MGCPRKPRYAARRSRAFQVETTDLSEIDVVKFMIGDKAIVTFDAIPELVVEGTIIRIAPKADLGSGVNYPVTIER